MTLLPKVLTTSVVRSSHQGESHGGVYLVDLARGDHELILDWNDPSISWEGRGHDRGLRGVAFHGDLVLLAASNEIFIYDSAFRRVDSMKNPYLNHCHEIFVQDGSLFSTSTGFDSILRTDLDTGRFEIGWRLSATLVPPRPRRQIAGGSQLQVSPVRVREFDPASRGGPSMSDSLHINSVTHAGGHVHFAGTRLRGLYTIDRHPRATRVARLPNKTHNARTLNDDVVFNDTAANAVRITDRKGHARRSFEIPRYPPSQLLHADLPLDHARQGFGRGLAIIDSVLVGGSSPGTITAYDIETGDVLQQVNLTMDVRNAIHGLEVWPFG